MGTSLAGNLVAELVVLLRDIPSGESESCGAALPILLNQCCREYLGGG